MNVIRKIAVGLMLMGALALSACASEEAKPSDAKAPAKAECVCKAPEGPNCVTVNARNRYDEEGAMKRRIYPRHLHYGIKQSVKCGCDCHA